MVGFFLIWLLRTDLSLAKSIALFSSTPPSILLKQIADQKIDLQPLINPKKGLIYLKYHEDSPADDFAPTVETVHLCGKALEKKLPEIRERLASHLKLDESPTCRLQAHIQICTVTIQMEYGSQMQVYFSQPLLLDYQIDAITIGDYGASPRIIMLQEKKMKRKLKLFQGKSCF